MALDIESSPDSLIEALRNRGLSDERITRMSGKEAFAEYCNWHGLLGWGDRLWRIVEACQEQDAAAEIK